MQDKKYPLLIIFCSILLSFMTGCQGLKDAREIKSGTMPPKYYATKENEPALADGQLWKDPPSLYEDRRARRVNDLLTILIVENVNATNAANTDANAASSATYDVANLFGANTNFGIQSWPLIKGLYAGGLQFTPTVSGSSTSAYKGAGDTTRTGTVTASIAVKVVDVLPNSNLVIESRKEVVVNNDKQIIVLKGIVRPDDISTSNTIASTLVADAQIYIVGDGVLDDKQSQGWLVRAMDKVWPF
ncbi:MAG: flagellar basal body L-ring protein FlgH [Dissulfurispiraceae bacterium]